MVYRFIVSLSLIAHLIITEFFCLLSDCKCKLSLASNQWNVAKMIIFGDCTDIIMSKMVAPTASISVLCEKLSGYFGKPHYNKDCQLTLGSEDIHLTGHHKILNMLSATLKGTKF